MTSETLSKPPTIITVNMKKKATFYLGWIVIFSTWIYIYFNVVGLLYDGISSLLQSEFHYIARKTLKIVTSTISSISAGGDEVEFGSLKYYALCGFGGILSCGITVSPSRFNNPKTF